MLRTKRIRFICTPGWSPSHPVNTTPAAVGSASQFGTDGRVDLGIHQDQVLAVREAIERQVAAEFDRPGDVDDDVDAVGPRDRAESHR